MFLFFFLFNPQTPQFSPNIVSRGSLLSAQGASFPEASAVLWVDVLRSFNPTWRDACGVVSLLLEQTTIPWVDLESVVCVWGPSRRQVVRPKVGTSVILMGVESPRLPSQPPCCRSWGFLRKANACLWYELWIVFPSLSFDFVYGVPFFSFLLWINKSPIYLLMITYVSTL